MENVNIKDTATTGVLNCPYSSNVLQGFVALQDLADIARLVIEDPTPHDRARYEVVGQNLTLEDVARVVSTSAGKEVVCHQVPRDQIIPKSIIDVKVQGPYMQEGLDRMLYYYDTRCVWLFFISCIFAHVQRRGIPGNSNNVRWLLGREPRSWEVLVKQTLGKQ